MRRVLSLVFVLIVALRLDSAHAQTRPIVLVRFASATCLVNDVQALCRDIGAKLRDLGIPLDADIRFSPGGDIGYDVISNAIESLRRAGFNVEKVGFITSQK